MKIKIATEEEIKYCYEMMHQIREDLTERDFLSAISEQLKNGYKIVYVIQDEEIICIAGFTIGDKLSWGKHLLIEDFVTNKSIKSIEAAKANQKPNLQKNCGVNFYFLCAKYYTTSGQINCICRPVGCR